MPNQLSPGVFVEEQPTGPRRIDGVSTSTAAFVGVTEQGPRDPVLTTSWQEYQRWFGGYLPEAVSYLPHAVQGFFDNGGRRLYVARVADPPDAAAYTAGLAAIEALDETEVSLLAVPDEVRFASATTAGPITTAVIEQCERLKNRFGIISTGRGENDVSQLRPSLDTMYGAIYHPWIEILDPLTGRALQMPATGHVAGLIARVDVERGVNKAPANEALRGVTNLEFQITDAVQEVLNPRGVNVIRDFRAAGRGIRVWGARTMSSNPDWKYINVRRFLTFIEISIDKGTQWVVFEPNGEALWERAKQNITDFLMRLWQSGALMGNRPEQAFSVKFDRTTMTQDDIDNGRLIGLVGVAPVRPAEFVIVRISRRTSSGHRPPITL